VLQCNDWKGSWGWVLLALLNIQLPFQFAVGCALCYRWVYTYFKLSIRLQLQKKKKTQLIATLQCLPNESILTQHQKGKPSCTQQSKGRAPRRKYTIREGNVQCWRQDSASTFACKTISKCFTGPKKGRHADMNAVALS